jgi:hypothetical protein
MHPARSLLVVSTSHKQMQKEDEEFISVDAVTAFPIYTFQVGEKLSLTTFVQTMPVPAAQLSYQQSIPSGAPPSESQLDPSGSVV